MPRPIPSRGAVRRNAGPAALVVATLALLSSLTGVSEAARDAIRSAVSRPQPGAVLRLDQHGRFPARAIPKVNQARRADRLGTLSAKDVELNCDATTVDLGTWCLSVSPFPVPPEDAGKNDFLYATQACAEDGGFLPSAAELVGAANRVKLSSYINDGELGASVDIDPTDGLADRREMSSTLITTQSGGSAAGLLGVSDGSRGNPRTGEPNPVVVAAVPAPDTLQYVTVVDNHDKGGFAGSKPVGQAEAFRCGYNKRQGPPRGDDN